MGLLLSVLVACVGVIELISFYSNVKRNLTLLPISGDISSVRENYKKELSDFRKRTEVALQGNHSAAVVKENNVSSTYEHHVPPFRLLSHEDIEIEYKENVLASGTRNPRRFLVTEKEVKDKGRSPSPRYFVVSEEPQGISKSQCKTSIPEFFIQEQSNPKKSPNHPRYVLKDHEGRSASPIPLPSQFLVTENEFADALESTDTSSEISGTKSDYEHVEYNRRSPSPYPPLDLPLGPRNSISNELVDDPFVSVLEVDEELYKSRSSSPRGRTTVQVTDHISNSVVSPIGKTQNISNEGKELLAATVIERAKFKLQSEGRNQHVLVCEQSVQKIASIPHLNGKECTGIPASFESLEENFSEDSTYDEKYLNNLDGIGKQKFVKKNYSAKKTIKRITVSSSVEEQSCSKSDDSPRNGNLKILVQDAETLENQSMNENTKDTSVVAGTKEPEVKKEPEPFWLIFSGEYTKAMNKDWHGQHFCCWQCDESLTGQRYVLRDDHPYCVSCYESVFANACEKCSRTIGIDSKDLSYKDKHWHEACFLCTTCGESLVDKQFGSKGDRIYCGSCYDQQFASRCDGCHEIFRAGTKKMEYKTRQWHEKCFCCNVCKVPIGTQSFIPREQEIYCAKCYEEKFATRCIKCNKVITSGGVTYKNEPWHRECFTCTHCQKSLAGERFTSRDEKPFCAECFGELFAKRCTACNKPITGIGGTKFISFEDRHWHNDCFFCASCRTSLVGRGFITDNEDIICPECAKQKLM